MQETKLVGHTTKYSPQNQPITPCVNLLRDNYSIIIKIVWVVMSAMILQSITFYSIVHGI